MRYDRLLNPEKHLIYRLRSGGTPNSSTVQYRTLWSVTLQLLEADQATIPHMKGEVHSYQMGHGSMICSKRLLSYST